MKADMVWIAVCVLGGLLTVLLSEFWIKKLEEKRRLKGELSRVVEISVCCLTVFGAAAAGFLTDGFFSVICAMLFLVFCLTAAVMDLKYRIIPNETVLAIIGLKLMTGIGAVMGWKQLVEFNIVQSLLGLSVCFAVFILPGFFGKSVGAGDVKLAAAMGFFLGFEYALLGIIIMGLAVIAYTVFQTKVPMLKFLKAAIPMAPFICAGMYLALVGVPLIS